MGEIVSRRAFQSSREASESAGRLRDVPGPCELVSCATLNRIRSALRRGAEIAYAAAWKLGVRPSAPTEVQRSIFERIYETNSWGDAESRSGPGSTVARAATLRTALAGLFSRFSVKTLLDAPCGERYHESHLAAVRCVTND